MRRIWATVANNAEQIKIAFALIVALFVLIEYLDRQWDDRINRALEYVDLRHRADTLTAHVNSQIFLLDRDQIMEKFDALFDQSQDDHDYDRAIADLVEEAVRSLQPREASLQQRHYIHNLRDFYSAVAHCTLTEQCDPLTTCTSFFGEIQLFRRLYAKYFEEWDNKLQMKSTYLMDRFSERCDDPIYFRALGDELSIFDEIRLKLGGLIRF